jgi:hypothetical protein
MTSEASSATARVARARERTEARSEEMRILTGQIKGGAEVSVGSTELIYPAKAEHQTQFS